MDEVQLQKDARRAKKWNVIIISIFLVILLLSLVGLGIFKYQHTFTVEKWLREPNYRTKIVDDLFNRHKLIGMTEGEIISLLGEEESYANTKTSFKISNKKFEPENTIVYYLGVSYMDDMWLILCLEDGIVTEYYLDVT